MAGCSKPSPEQVMIGQWTMDAKATEKTNPLMAAMPGGMWYEFKADGSYAERLSEGAMRSSKKGTWKQVKKEGGTLTVELAAEGEKEPQVVEDRDGRQRPHHGQLPQRPRGYPADADHGRCCAEWKGITSRPGRDNGVATRQPRHGHSKNHEAGISADGKFAAVRVEKQKETVQIWDLEKKQKVRTFDDPDGWQVVKDLALSPDGKLVAYDQFIAGIQIKDVATGNKLHEFHPKAATTMVFSPPGDLLVVAASYSLMGWNPITGKQAFESKDVDDGVIALSGFFEDGKKIASGGKNNTICIWEMPSGKLLQKLVFDEANTAPGTVPDAVAVSPDGKRLAAIQGFRPIKIWDLPANKVIKSMDVSSTGVLSFLPDGKTLVYGNENNIIIENLETGAKKVLTGHTDRVTSGALSRDGKILVSADNKDGTVKVWDVQAP